MLHLALQIVAAASQALAPLIVLLIQGKKAFVEFSGLYYAYSLVVFFSTLGFDVFLGKSRAHWTLACGFFLCTTSVASVLAVAAGMVGAGWSLAGAIGLAAFSSALVSWAQYLAMEMNHAGLMQRLAQLKILAVLAVPVGAALSLDPPGLFRVFALVLLLAALLSLWTVVSHAGTAAHAKLDRSAIPATLFMFANFSFAGILLNYERSLVASTVQPDLAAVYLACSTALSALTYIGVGYERSRYGKDNADWRQSVLTLSRYVTPFALLAMGGAIALLQLGKAAADTRQLTAFAIALGAAMTLLAATHAVLYFSLAARVFLDFSRDDFKRMAHLNLLLGAGVFILCSVVLKPLDLPEAFKPWAILLAVWACILGSDLLRFKRALGLEKYAT